MSTRYYWHSTPCAHCGRAEEPIYIGKTGSKFALKVYRDRDKPHTLLAWVDLFGRGKGQIVSEGMGETVIPAVELVYRIMSVGYVDLADNAE